MHELKAGFYLLLGVGFAVYYAYLAWRARPSSKEGRPGSFVFYASFVVVFAALVWSDAALIAHTRLPQWWVWITLPAMLLTVVGFLWRHVEDLRDAWSGRVEAPDPAQYPTPEWTKAAVWGTLAAVALLCVFYRWRLPYPGIFGLFAALFAVIAWARWAWARWTLFLIRRIQARRSPSLPPA